jgi:DNA-binding transcriptional MocR family regulator
MLAALERTMPADTRWTSPGGGFFSWLTLPEAGSVGGKAADARPANRVAFGAPGGGDAELLAKRAVEAGVGIVPGSVFFADGRGGSNVRLSFSLVDESAIDEGIQKLAELL